MSDDINGWTKEEKEQLQQYSARIERILDEIDDRNEDKKAILNDAKDAGFTPSVLMAAIKRKRAEEKNPGKFDSELSSMEFYFKIIDD